MWPKKRKKPQKQPKTLLISAVIKKIGPHFVKSPEGAMWTAALRVALIDLNSRLHRASALKFLNGPMHLMQLAGVDPDWIRDVIKRAGLID